MMLSELSDDVLEKVLCELPARELCQSVMVVNRRLRDTATKAFNRRGDFYFTVNLADEGLLTRTEPLPYKRVILSRRKRNGVSLHPSDKVLDAVSRGDWSKWFRRDLESLSLYPTDEYYQPSISPLLRDVLKFQMLVRLDLSGLWVAEILESLAKLPKLKELILRGSSITEKELSHLSQLPSLKLLDLSFLQVYDRECGELLPRSQPLELVPKELEVLMVHDFNLERKLGESNFSTFSSFNKLRVLNLRSMCYFAVCDFGFLKNLPELEKLCLDTGGYVGDWNSVFEFAQAVAQPSRLQHVTLTKARGDFHHAFTKGRFPHLKTLNLTGSSLHLQTSTEPLVELDELNISYCSVVNAQCLPLKTMKAINLRHCRYLSSYFMDVLGECHNLERLLLDGNDSNATNLRKLHRLKQLRVLSVNSPWVGNLGLRAISFLRNIEYLSAKQCNLSDLGLKHLQELKHLRFANLTGNAFSKEAAETISHMPNMEMEKLLIDSNTDGKISSSKTSMRNLMPSITAAFSVAEYGVYPRDTLYPPHM